MTTLYHDTFPLLLRLIHPLPSLDYIPFPFSPSSLQPFLYSPPTSLPLLPQLPWCHVTMHVPAIADPNIAKVMRLASLLPIIIHSLLSLTTPVEAYMWLVYTIRCSLSCAHPGIACRDTKLKLINRYSHISDLVRSPPDLWISSVTLGPSFFGFGHRTDTFGYIRIILGSI